MIPRVHRIKDLGARLGDSRLRRLWVSLRALLAVVFFGSIGYFTIGQLYYHGVLTPQLQQPWNPVDCVYMTVITVSTIGYGETLPLNPGTTLEDFLFVRVYTVSVILVAMLIVGYSVSSATAFLVEGDLKRIVSRRRALKEIGKLRDHFIVCGAGVHGTVILEELIATHKQAVVIDSREDQLEQHRHHKDLTLLLGDATTMDTLREAGIEHARGLAAALPNDKDNVFLILTARQLNPNLRIVSLSSAANRSDTLRMAGADAVVASSFIGGLRLASELFRPAVVTFLDYMLRGDTASPVRFAEIQVGPGWAGKTVGALELHQKAGLPVLAIKPADSQDFVFNPPDSHLLRQGDALVTMGESKRIEKLRKLAR